MQFARFRAALKSKYTLLFWKYSPEVSVFSTPNLTVGSFGGERLGSSAVVGKVFGRAQHPYSADFIHTVGPLLTGHNLGLINPETPFCYRGFEDRTNVKSAYLLFFHGWEWRRRSSISLSVCCFFLITLWKYVSVRTWSSRLLWT